MISVSRLTLKHHWVQTVKLLQLCSKQEQCKLASTGRAKATAHKVNSSVEVILASPTARKPAFKTKLMAFQPKKANIQPPRVSVLDHLSPAIIDLQEYLRTSGNSTLVTCLYLTIPVRTGRVSTCDNSLCSLLFGVNPHNVSSKLATGVQSVINTNFRTQVLEEEEDYKGDSPSAASVNMIRRRRDLL